MYIHAYIIGLIEQSINNDLQILKLNIINFIIENIMIFIKI